MTAQSIEERLLEAVPFDDEDPVLTFHYAGSQTRFRLYHSEYDYRTLTKGERRTLLRLIDEGRLRLVHGWQFGRGYVGRVPQPSGEAPNAE